MPSIFVGKSGWAAVSKRSVLRAGTMPTAGSADCSMLGTVAGSSHLPPSMSVAPPISISKIFVVFSVRSSTRKRFSPIHSS